MARHRWIRLAAFVVVALALAISSLGAFAAAHGGTGQVASVRSTANVTASAKKGPQLQILDEHTVNAATVPQETKAQQAASASGSMPALLRPNAKTLEQKTSLAQRAAAAPHNAGENLASANSAKLLGPEFPSVFNKFPAQSDSATTCPYFPTCQPPDMAVAAAPTGLALQVVNTSLDLYNNNGVQQSGWPKNSQTFFGIPNPTPSGCDTHGPYTTDPRAWFDAYDNRFGVAMLQIEDANGLATGCTFVSKFWIAISTSNNPSGTWRIFSLNMAFGSDPTGFVDYTQFGFNADGIYLSGNIFNNADTAYDYAEVVGCGKQAIYSGGSIVCHSYYDLTIGSVVVDTVNPVQSLSTDFGPHAEYFVSSFNSPDPAGDDCVTTACNGLSVWAWSDPANTTGSGNLFGGMFVATAHNYLEPPGADQPSCTGGAGCLESLDNRISASPTYHAGHIFAAHVTGVTNGAGQFVPGIQWFDIVPALAPGYPTKLTGLTLYQDGLLNGSSGFVATTFPVIMPDLDNDLMLGYDYMGDAIFPSINFTSRRVSDPLSTLPGGLGIVEVAGTASTADTRWGDFEAMSYPATYQDFIWFGSQYATSTDDWNTELIKLRFNLNG